MINGSHWVCSPPLLRFKLPKTTVKQTKTRHPSIWSARLCAQRLEAGPVFFCAPRLLFSALHVCHGRCSQPLGFPRWTPDDDHPVGRVLTLPCHTVDHTVLERSKHQPCSLGGKKRPKQACVWLCERLNPMFRGKGFHPSSIERVLLEVNPTCGVQGSAALMHKCGHIPTCEWHSGSTLHVAEAVWSKFGPFQSSVLL